AIRDSSIPRPLMQNPPTICQLVHSLCVGGAEVLAMRLGRQLAADYRFVYACLDEIGTLGQELRQEGVTVVHLRRQPGLDWRCARRLRALLRDERVDIIHAPQYTPFFYAALARFPRRRPPIVFTEHGRWYPDLRSAKRVAANRVLLSRWDRV